MHLTQGQSVSKFDRAMPIFEILFFRSYNVSSPFSEPSFLVKTPLHRDNESGTYGQSEAGIVRE